MLTVFSVSHNNEHLESAHVHQRQTLENTPSCSVEMHMVYPCCTSLSNVYSRAVHGWDIDDLATFPAFFSARFVDLTPQSIVNKTVPNLGTGPSWALLTNVWISNRLCNFETRACQWRLRFKLRPHFGLLTPVKIRGEMDEMCESVLQVQPRTQLLIYFCWGTAALARRLNVYWLITGQG